MKKYAFYTPIVMAFYSRDIYRDVARSWKGISAGYLLFLTALLTIPLAVSVHMSVNRFIVGEGRAIIDQIPRLTISGGVLSTPEQRPYYIREPERSRVIAVIDTTTMEAPAYPDVPVVVTRRLVRIRKSAVETRTYSFSSIDHFVLTRERLNRWLSRVGAVIGFVLYPFTVIGVFLYRLVQALVLSLVALLASRLCGARLPYGALYRLTVVAMTPAIVIGMVHQLSGMKTPLWGLWALLIAVGYVVFAIRSAAGAGEEPTGVSGAPR